jgi:hypothetical protein
MTGTGTNTAVNHEKVGALLRMSCNVFRKFLKSGILLTGTRNNPANRSSKSQTEKTLCTWYDLRLARGYSACCTCWKEERKVGLNFMSMLLGTRSCFAAAPLMQVILQGPGRIWVHTYIHIALTRSSWSNHLMMHVHEKLQSCAFGDDAMRMCTSWRIGEVGETRCCRCVVVPWAWPPVRLAELRGAPRLRRADTSSDPSASPQSSWESCCSICTRRLMQRSWCISTQTCGQESRSKLKLKWEVKNVAAAWMNGEKPCK